MKLHHFRLFYISLLFIISSAVHAATFSLMGCNYATVSITYESVDASNRPITLSAVLYYPTSSGTSENNIKTCDYIFLNNHATITDDASSPSGGMSAMGQLYWMTTENALVVNPDYLGFGISREFTHPYMCQTLTARNVVDCVKAAIADAQRRGKLASNYYTLNCGYSQGGGVTMAVARYLEQDADETTQRLVNLRSSICGAGCYSQTLIFDDYESRPSIDYPIYLPYVIMGLKEAYGESCLRGIELQNCFTPTFRNSGILDLLRQKNTDVDALNSQLKAVFGGQCGFYDIISADYRDHHSALYRALRKALAKNDLIDDWVPQHPITFYHFSNDEVVPFANTTEAINRFQQAGCQVPLRLFKAEDITDYGNWNVAKLKYNNLKANHRDYGTCFYLAVFDGQLTPAAATDGWTGSSFVAGEMRHEIPCSAAANEWIIFVADADIDGYYFGPDALRYCVEGGAVADDEGRYVLGSLATMDDAADFCAGECYLVQPKSTVERIVSMTAGVATAVADDVTPLLSRQLAVATTFNAVGSRAYATVYSPFDVSVGDDIDVYTAQMGLDGKMHLFELTDHIVPARTGVVLRADASIVDAPQVLAYAQGVEQGFASDLTGSLTSIANPGNVLTLGTNAGGQLGFFHYQGASLAAGKAYYELPEGSAASSRGVLLDLDDNAPLTSLSPDPSVAQGLESFDLLGRRVSAHDFRGGLRIFSKRIFIR